MQAEGIWGAAEKSRKSEEPEVRRRMLKWFGHEVVWGGVEASVLLQVLYRSTKGMEQWRRGVYRYPTAIVSEYIEIGKYKNNRRAVSRASKGVVWEAVGDGWDAIEIVWDWIRP